MRRPSIYRLCTPQFCPDKGGFWQAGGLLEKYCKAAALLLAAGHTGVLALNTIPLPES
jgi:hypothetical protein